ncbi:pilin secretion/fimbrial assembly system protein, PilC [Clostridium gelidum]|uniref:Pilin secretion/fimbrial assembly system protein, PilC n=1 Tax=Clostridium gelidum TaxID=704125 RepID=A0ABN6IXP3_9CLOT|nr:type II secretion system F family protein [Clostridium gelidum]BCZ46899.1 pilin secretion/fimbrial assembly system protein, PilC [Clostridium gelidum]
MNSSNIRNKINVKSKLNFDMSKVLESFSFHNITLGLQFKSKVNEEQLLLIASNLAQIYKDGIPITTALELVADTLPNKTYRKSMLKVLVLIKQGKSLSEGFSQFKELYPEFFIGIISIGENTGKLYEVLKGLNIYYEKSLFIKKEIKNASAYPIFILVSMIILIIFLVNKVIPSFCEIYKSMNIELPANCKLLYDINSTLKNNPLLTTITMISWGLISIILIKCLFKKINIERFTKINIVKSFFEYIMVLLFSIITSTGINISQALEYCENSMSYPYLRKKIKEINISILKGSTLTEALEKSRLFSKYTLAIIKIREESGTIEEGFKELSNSLEYKLFEQIKKYLGFISPTFVVIMAIFIVLFLLGFVLPLFNNLKSGMR